MLYTILYIYIYVYLMYRMYLMYSILLNYRHISMLIMFIIQKTQSQLLTGNRRESTRGDEATTCDDVSTVLFFTASNRSRPPVADVHPGVELDESPGEIYRRTCPVQSPVGLEKYILKICTCPYINVVITQKHVQYMFLNDKLCMYT